MIILKYPNKCFSVFCCFYGFICDFLEFPLLKFQHACSWIRIINTKKVGFVNGRFSDFCKFMSFTALNMVWSYKFPYSQIFTASLSNIIEFYRAHVDVIKYRNILTFTFERALLTVIPRYTRAVWELYQSWPPRTISKYRVPLLFPMELLLLEEKEDFAFRKQSEKSSNSTKLAEKGRKRLSEEQTKVKSACSSHHEKRYHCNGFPTFLCRPLQNSNAK